MINHVSENSNQQDLEQKKLEVEKKKLQLEIERSEFDREMEQSKLELERARLKQARKETWVRGVLATFIAVLIPTSVTLYTLVSEKQRTQRQEAKLELEKRKADEDRKQQTLKADEDRKQQTLIQLVNAREAADADLRARMFATLMEHYFTIPRNHQSQIAILELVGLNFRDAVQIKPMFEMLDADLTQLSKDDSEELISKLRGAAKTVVRDQLAQIRQAEHGYVCEVSLSKGNISRPACLSDLAIQLIDASTERIEVQTNTKNGSFLSEEKDIENGDSFNVTHFDMPMIDYTVVTTDSFDLWKYSITLEGVPDSNSAVVIVSVLPEDTYSTRHEYKFDEMLSDYLAPN